MNRKKRRIRQTMQRLRGSSVVKNVDGTLNVNNLIELVLYDCKYIAYKENLNIANEVLKELNIL